MSLGFDPARRRFLRASAGAGGALIVSSALPPRASRAAAARDGDVTLLPSAMLRIGPERIVVHIPHSEMGQGVMTSLAMLIAEELEVDLADLAVEMAPADRAYDHPSFRLQATGGSTSIRGRFQQLREAGALGRALLVGAAARRWSVSPDACRAERGAVVHPETGERAPYLELAAEAAKLRLPDRVELKPRAQQRLLGTRQPRVDIPGKVDGSAVFGIDVKREGLLTASIARSPTFGGSLVRFSAERALAVPGVRHVVAISSGVAVVADGYWQAQQGRAQLEIEWDRGPHGETSSADLWAAYRELVEKPGNEVRSDGDAEGELERAADVIDVFYEVPFLAHATMEPMNAVAHVHDGGCEIWAPTQSQGLTRQTAARLLGISQERVRVETTQLGGGFGRRAEVDYVIEAVEISMQIEKPVKVVFSREDDMQAGFYRPAVLHRLRAAVDAEGNARAWSQRIAASSVTERMIPLMVPAALPNGTPGFLSRAAAGGARFFARRMADPPAVEGAEQLPYAYPSVRVEYARHAGFVPVGFWRSVGHSHNAFVVESFVDELAHRAGRDPLAYRMDLLATAPRHRAVLELAAAKAGWGTPSGDRHRGLAVHESFGSWVAMVAEVSLSAERSVRVHRVVVAVDCGQVVNPDGVEAQIEGGLAYGLSAALLPGRIDIERGAPVQRNFDGYQVLRMSDMPDVEIHLIQSDAAPGGVGEIATPPIAPAVANAVFAATGKRVRQLPITSELLA
jgi:isoquinoline 1-oxidoreductase subunit beta